MSHRILRSALLFITTAAIGLPVLAQSWQVPKPSPGLMPNATTGKKLFEKNCASCHGINLKGSKEGPPFLHPYYVPSHHGDPAFQLAVKNGVQAHHWKFGDMKPVPGLSPNDVAHITAYVRYQQRLVGIK
ncbi:MAG: cytochrome c [Sulfuritalea sp.]|nr:cytochrome c [Sulfuritalea sp.]